MSGIPWNDPGYTERDVYEVGEDVERLAAMLDALDGKAMTIAAVDGYLTALALFRESIPVSEWMAQVWSKDARFESVKKAELETAIIKHYNRIARTLSSEPENYGLVLQEKESTGELIWDEWVLGFEYAARLRPTAWARIEACKEPSVVEAVGMVKTLYGAVTGEFRVEEEKLAGIGPFVPVVICGIVRDLNERDRPRGASKAERLDPAVPGTVGASSEPDAKGGCGSERRTLVATYALAPERALTWFKARFLGRTSTSRSETHVHHHHYHAPKRRKRTEANSVREEKLNRPRAT